MQLKGKVNAPDATYQHAEANLSYDRLSSETLGGRRGRRRSQEAVELLLSSMVGEADGPVVWCGI